MSPKAINEARHQARRENVGKRLKICAQCSKRLARHSADGKRLCCYCYVAAGNEPADWHPECMAAAAALRDASDAGHA